MIKIRIRVDRLDTENAESGVCKGQEWKFGLEDYIGHPAAFSEKLKHVREIFGVMLDEAFASFEQEALMEITKERSRGYYQKEGY